MKNFLLGLAVGALGAYVAIKLSDEDTRNDLCKKARDFGDKAKDGLDYNLSVGKSKALRAGVVARDEYRKANKMVNEVAGDIAGKLSEELSDFEEKARANS